LLALLGLLFLWRLCAICGGDSAWRKRPGLAALEINAHNHLTEADFIAVAELVWAVSSKARTIQKGAVAAAQVPEIKVVAIVALADECVFAANAHTVACEWRQVHIGHGASGRVTTPKDSFLFGLEQNRFSAFDFDA
jgi:hypothetical protein